MIVTPDGLNVFPEDVERALLAQPGVRDAAVVGRRWDGEERVHAVLVLDDPERLPQVVQHANATLADHQKIRSASHWTGTRPAAHGGHPQAETDGAPRLGRVRRAGERSPRAPARIPLRHVLAKFAKGRDDVGDDTTLEALALSSLERVELLMALEQQFQTIVDEGAFAVGAHRRRPAGARRDREPGAGNREPARRTDRRQLGRRESGVEAQVDRRPSHRTARRAVRTRHRPVRRPGRLPPLEPGTAAVLVRRVSLATWILPLGRLFAWIRVNGLEHLAGLEGPVVFAANHQSHMDTPVVLMALPRRWRSRTAVAMAKEFFTPHFHPAGQPLHRRVTNGLNYYLASLFFNAFPIPQREAGTRHTLRYIGQLFGEGQSLLIFPEGKRTMAGEINEFRAGIGMIGAKLGVPVVPIRLVGADRLLHQKARFPTPGRVTVRFGPPLYLQGDDYAALARQVEAAVRALLTE